MNQDICKHDVMDTSISEETGFTDYQLKCECGVDLNPLYFSALHRHYNYPVKSTRLFFPFFCARSESVKSRGEAKYILIWTTRLFIEIAWMLVCDEHSFPSAFYTN